MHPACRPRTPADLCVSLQVALYIWDNGKGPHLTAVPELCTEPEDSPQARGCATTLSRDPPLCVSICSVSWSVSLSSIPRNRRGGKKWNKNMDGSQWYVGSPVAFVPKDTSTQQQYFTVKNCLVCYCCQTPFTRTLCINLKMTDVLGLFC